jgi:alpha-beta hydrolase superfamily lysophospholipase
MGIRRIEGGAEGEDGVHLFRRSWLPDDPVRVVLLVHGFAEHSGRYGTTSPASTRSSTTWRSC